MNWAVVALSLANIVVLCVLVRELRSVLTRRSSGSLRSPVSLDAILDSSPFPILLVDSKGGCVAEFGNPDGPGGRTILSHLDEAGQRAYRDALAAAFRENRRGEVSISHREQWHRLEILPLRVEESSDGLAVLVLQDVTEYRQAEQRLERLDNRNAAILRSAMDGLFIADEDGRFIEVNDAFSRMTGYDSADLYQMRVSDLEVDDTGSATDAISPRTGLNHFTTRNRHRDGRVIQLETSVMVLRDGGQRILVGFARDVTDRCRAEEALRESERRYRELFEQSRDPIYISARDGELLDVNQAFVDLFGRARHELIGSNVREFYVYEEDRQRFRSEIEAHGEVRDFAAVLRRGDGAVMDCLFTSTLKRSPEGMILGYQGIIRDITRRKLAEASLRRRDAILEAVAFAADRFLELGEWKRCIEPVLAHLGAAVGVSRVYLFERHSAADGGDVISQRYEWVSAGITPDRDNPALQGLDWKSAGFQRWHDLLQRGEPVHGHVRDFPESERTLLLESNVRSVLVVPIFAGQAAWGFIGFDECHAERTWSNAEVDALKTLAGTLGAAIERQAAEQELRQSEQRFRQLAENVREVFWLASPELREFNYVSPAFQEIWGHGATDLSAVAQLFIDSIHPDDRARVLSAIRDRGTQAPFEEEYRIVRSDGAQRWVSTRISPVRNDAGEVFRLAGVSEDITHRKQAEEGLRASELRYRQLFENNRAVKLLIDAESGAIVDANAAACEFYGYSRTRLVTLRLTDLNIRPPEEVMANAALAARGEKSSFELQHRLASGELRDVLVNTGPIHADGRVLLFSIVHDVTERKRAEAERQQLEMQVQHSRRLESLGILAGGVAHDFNNFLVSILCNASLAMESETLGEDVSPHVQKIVNASRRASELTRQLLAYSGKGAYDVRPLDLNELVRDMADFMGVALAKNVSLKISLAEGLPQIEADSGQIQQVIVNLLINASEAIGVKPGTVELSTSHRFVDAAEIRRSFADQGLSAGHCVCLEVRDTGCGMSDEVMARIFDPFFTTKFTGRGLGLAAILGIVRAHHGAIRVTSQVDKGTSFVIVFPAAALSVSLPVRRATPAGVPEGATILVIDDEEEIRDVLKSLLERRGVKVLTAEDGPSGIRLFRENASTIDLVLLDLTMPGMNGAEVLNEISEIQPDACVIVSSGYSEQEAAQRFRNRRPAAFVQKPYTAEKLFETVSWALAAAAT